jgi:hypothetical protein
LRKRLENGSGPGEKKGGDLSRKRKKEQGEVMFKVGMEYCMWKRRRLITKATKKM